MDSESGNRSKRYLIYIQTTKTIPADNKYKGCFVVILKIICKIGMYLLTVGYYKHIITV
jgi:hypothetical protein